MQYRFEIAKYYDFENRAFGYSARQLEQLQAQGMGQNYWVVGYSDWLSPIKIPSYH